MKKIIPIMFIFIYVTLFSQKKFDVKYEADYKLLYKLTNNENSHQYDAAFALLLNDKSSYFKNMNKYIADSLTLEKKIKTSGNTQKDISNYYNKYYTDFPENIGITSGKIYFSTEIEGKAFEYEEANNIDWKLFSEFKNIAGYKCQKAETIKYGRKWTAWFTNEIPFPFGPYKFNRLPGLIVEISDEKKDYIYSLYSFKKRKFTCNSANMYTNSKRVSKEKIFNYKKNKFQNIDRLSKYVQDKSEFEELKKNALEISKKYNPIELSID